jgi:hypothetical protein
MKKIILFSLFVIFIFNANISLALDYKIGSKVTGSFAATKKLKIDLPAGVWNVIEKKSWYFYGLRAFSYSLVRLEKNKVVEGISITELHTAGVYEGQLNSEIIKIFFKGKYDGCYERPEYYYLNFYRKGSTFNCFLVRHGVPEKEIYDPDDPYLRNTNSQIKKWIKDNAIELPKIMLGSEHLYFSRLVYGKIYGVSYSLDPSILSGPEISFFTEESSEYHKNRIQNYPEHEKIMKKWMLISAERHRNFENAVRAKDRHHLNLEAFSLVDNKFNNDKETSSDIVKEIQKLNDLYKDGVLTNEEFEKAKKKILN